jgi:hypothetical protein
MARFNKIYTKKLYMADGKKKDQQDSIWLMGKRKINRIR